MTSKEEKKYQRFLDAQEHPENYSDEQLDDILHDAEDIISMKRAFMQERAEHEPVDTGAAWRELTERQTKHDDPAENPTGTAWRQWMKTAAAFAGGVVATSVAFAAIVSMGIVGNPFAQHPENATTAAPHDSITIKPVAVATKSDSLRQQPRPMPQTVRFDNTPLSEIVHDMATYYNADVSYGDNSNARSIRLCFEWNQTKSLAENIALLNSFQQINIVLEGNRITVE